jgi:predicted membrane protein
MVIAKNWIFLDVFRCYFVKTARSDFRLFFKTDPNRTKAHTNILIFIGMSISKNLSKLNCIKLDRINFLFVIQNRTTNKFIFGSDAFLPQYRSKSNCEHLYLIFVLWSFCLHLIYIIIFVIKKIINKVIFSKIMLKIVLPPIW